MVKFNLIGEVLLNTRDFQYCATAYSKVAWQGELAIENLVFDRESKLPGAISTGVGFDVSCCYVVAVISTRFGSMLVTLPVGGSLEADMDGKVRRQT